MLEVETLANFFYSPVGIMLLHRNLWEECGGYDERLIYWGWMEIDMAHRLRSKYPLVDLGEMVGHDFYHLEHYDARLPRKTPRKLNPTRAEDLDLFPNGPDWGLSSYDLPLLKCSSGSQAMRKAEEGSPQPGRAQSPLLLPATMGKVLVSAPYRVIQTAALSCSRTVAKLIRAVGKPRRYPEYAGTRNPLPEMRFIEARLVILVCAQPETNSAAGAPSRPLPPPGDTLSPANGERDGMRGGPSEFPGDWGGV